MEANAQRLAEMERELARVQEDVTAAAREARAMKQRSVKEAAISAALAAGTTIDGEAQVRCSRGVGGLDRGDGLLAVAQPARGARRAHAVEVHFRAGPRGLGVALLLLPHLLVLHRVALA